VSPVLQGPSIDYIIFSSDGKDLKIDEFVNVRYPCSIALEDRNSFIVTGGVLYGVRYVFGRIFA
jgi:hypothetical protein